MRHRIPTLLLVLVLATGARPQPTPAPSLAERFGPEVAAVAQALCDAMGGHTAWDGMRYLRFDWVAERDGQEAARVAHLWDRWDGRARVEWRRDGKFYQVVVNTRTKQGRAWVDGAPATGADSTALVDRACARVVNDGYWLLMPWKLEDPGVQLESAGTTQLDGQEYDLLHLSFDKVGLTPGDQYWAYVNRKTHRMDRWAYFLQDEKGEPGLEHATAWAWSDWQQVGGMMLARDRRQVGGDQPRRIHFPVLAVLASVDDGVLAGIDQPLPEGTPTDAAGR